MAEREKVEAPVHCAATSIRVQEFWIICIPLTLFAVEIIIQKNQSKGNRQMAEIPRKPSAMSARLVAWPPWRIQPVGVYLTSAKEISSHDQRHLVGGRCIRGVGAVPNILEVAALCSSAAIAQSPHRLVVPFTVGRYPPHEAVAGLPRRRADLARAADFLNPMLAAGAMAFSSNLWSVIV